ncbi:unnamed protein product [Phaeothamnion confervicola]
MGNEVGKRKKRRREDENEPAAATRESTAGPKRENAEPAAATNAFTTNPVLIGQYEVVLDSKGRCAVIHPLVEDVTALPNYKSMVTLAELVLKNKDTLNAGGANSTAEIANANWKKNKWVDLKRSGKWQLDVLSVKLRGEIKAAIKAVVDDVVRPAHDAYRADSRSTAKKQLPPSIGFRIFVNDMHGQVPGEDDTPSAAYHKDDGTCWSASVRLPLSPAEDATGGGEMAVSVIDRPADIESIEDDVMEVLPALRPGGVSFIPAHVAHEIRAVRGGRRVTLVVFWAR